MKRRPATYGHSYAYGNPPPVGQRQVLTDKRYLSTSADIFQPLDEEFVRLMSGHFRLRRQRRTIGQVPLGPGRRRSNQNDPRPRDPLRAGRGRPSAGLPLNCLPLDGHQQKFPHPPVSSTDVDVVLLHLRPLRPRRFRPQRRILQGHNR